MKKNKNEKKKIRQYKSRHLTRKSQEPYKFSATVDTRRDLVDVLDCMGFRQSEIVNELKKRGYFANYKKPYCAVTEDLMYVRAKRKEVQRQDIDSIRGEYIATNREILKRALSGEDGDFHSALEACKNIARVKGLDVDEVFKFKGAVLNVNTELSDEGLASRIKEIENVLTRTEARAIKKKNIRK